MAENDLDALFASIDAKKKEKRKKKKRNDGYQDENYDEFTASSRPSKMTTLTGNDDDWVEDPEELLNRLALPSKESHKEKESADDTKARSSGIELNNGIHTNELQGESEESGPALSAWEQKAAERPVADPVEKAPEPEVKLTGLQALLAGTGAIDRSMIAAGSRRTRGPAAPVLDNQMEFPTFGDAPAVEAEKEKKQKEATAAGAGPSRSARVSGFASLLSDIASETRAAPSPPLPSTDEAASTSVPSESTSQPEVEKWQRGAGKSSEASSSVLKPTDSVAMERPSSAATPPLPAPSAGAWRRGDRPSEPAASTPATATELAAVAAPAVAAPAVVADSSSAGWRRTEPTAMAESGSGEDVWKRGDRPASTAAVADPWKRGAPQATPAASSDMGAFRRGTADRPAVVPQEAGAGGWRRSTVAPAAPAPSFSDDGPWRKSAPPPRGPSPPPPAAGAPKATAYVPPSRRG